MAPFAVVGSEQVHNVSGRMVLGRQNGWGLVEIEDPSHCEFHHLRNLLIRLHSFLGSFANLTIFMDFVLFVLQESHAGFDWIDFRHPLRGFPPTPSHGKWHLDWHVFPQREPHLTHQVFTSVFSKNHFYFIFLVCWMFPTETSDQYKNTTLSLNYCDLVLYSSTKFVVKVIE